MPRCNHDPISVDLQITRRIIGTITDMGHTSISQNEPETLRIGVSCLACGYSNVLTTYHSGIGAAPWHRWPNWLIYRLTLMRHSQRDLDEAMTALGIPENGRKQSA